MGEKAHALLDRTSYFCPNDQSYRDTDPAEDAVSVFLQSPGLVAPSLETQRDFFPIMITAANISLACISCSHLKGQWDRYFNCTPSVRVNIICFFLLFYVCSASVASLPDLAKLPLTCLLASVSTTEVMSMKKTVSYEATVRLAVTVTVK